jgi:hypothetical protein
VGIFNFFLGFNPGVDYFLFCESIFKKGAKVRKLISLILLPFILISVCGCAPLIIGAAAGGLGAYAISKDTVQGDSDKSYDALWESAVSVAGMRGIIQQENANTGYIELSAESSKVWIRLIRLTQATTRIKISARKYHFPNMELAQDIFVKIITGAR